MKRFIAAVVTSLLLLTGCAAIGESQQKYVSAKCAAEIQAKTGHPFEVAHVKGLGPWDVLGTAGGTKYKCHVSKKRMNTSITETDWREPA